MSEFDCKDFVEKLRKASEAIFTTVQHDVACEISDLLTDAANIIEDLT